MAWERRAALELRADPDGRTVRGVAVRYGDTATIAPGLRERFAPGAFSELANVRLNVQHDRGRILSCTGSGLVLADSPEALRFEAELPDTREAADTLRLIRANILRGASVEFRAVCERLAGRVRVIQQTRLGAIAIVDDPAYSQSHIEARWQQPGPD